MFQRKGLMVFVVFVVLAVTANAFPWKDTTSIEVTLGNNEGTGWLKGFPFIDSSYAARFGAAPDFILWEDDKSLPCWTGGGIDFVENKTYPSVVDSMIGFMSIAAYSVKNVDSLRISMGNAAFDALGPERVLQRAYYGWRVDLRKLGIPDDSSAWRFRFEVWNAPWPNGTQRLATSGFATMICTNRSTPLDTLQWGRDSDIFVKQPEVAKRVLRWFPNNTELLSLLFEQACQTGAKDTVRSYAVRYLNSLKHRSDRIYFDRAFWYADSIDHDPGPLPITKVQYAAIIDSVLKIVGDTTGLTQFAPSAADSMPTFDYKHWFNETFPGSRDKVH